MNDQEKKNLEQEQDDICRFETISLQDMVAKFEPNLGFEKSFISVLALKVTSVKSLESIYFTPYSNSHSCNSVPRVDRICRR